MRCQRRVRWIPRWCWELRLVGAGAEVDCPVETVLD